MSDVASNHMLMERQIEYLHIGTNNLYLSSNHHFYLDTNDLNKRMNSVFLGKIIYNYLQIQQYISFF